MRKISIARRRLELIDDSEIPTTAEMRSLRRENARAPVSTLHRVEPVVTTLPYPISEADARILESIAAQERRRQLTARLNRTGPLLVLKLGPLLSGKRLLSCDQVSDVLGMSRTYVYRLARLGKLPVYRMGRSLRFDSDDISMFLSTCRSRGESCT